MDPLSRQEDEGISDPEKTPPDQTESLTLRVSDETRVAGAMFEASKRRKTGSIFSLTVDLSANGTLGLGVKVLKNTTLAISMLKRLNGVEGPGESAGVRLGRANFHPTLFLFLR